MTDQSPPGNSFRAAVLSGQRPKLLAEDKNPRHEASGDSLAGSMVSRSEVRSCDHRDGDRHRLADQSATIRHSGETHQVELVNLSGGGAMIACDFVPNLWDIVELDLGSGLPLEAAVRWVKNGRIGLEFAHETRIDCAPEARAAILLDVIQRSFPDVQVDLDLPDAPEPKAEPVTEQVDADLGDRSDIRHPMVWSGQILFAFDSNPVRLRNISQGGALVDIAMPYPLNAEVMLDLGDAGQFDAVVSWVAGEQAGLKFMRPFDLNCLAKLKPDLTPYRWQRPSFLEPSADDSDSPWDEQWRRRSITDLRSELEGYLKH